MPFVGGSNTRITNPRRRTAATLKKIEKSHEPPHRVTNISMHTSHISYNTQYKNESKHSEMGPVRRNPTQRTVSLFIALCTIVAHNIAQNRPDSFPPYPPDNHHFSDDVYLREGGKKTYLQQCSKLIYGPAPMQQQTRPLLGCSSSMVPLQRSPDQRRQVKSRVPEHCCQVGSVSTITNNVFVVRRFYGQGHRVT